MSELPSEPVAKVEVVDRHPVVPLALVIKTMVIGFTFALVLPLATVFYLDHRGTDRQLARNAALVKQNEELTKHLNRERIERQLALNEYSAAQCRKGEVRDLVIVQQNKALLALLSQFSPSQRSLFVDKLVQSLQDTNNILEPINEENCTPPPVVKP